MARHDLHGFHVALVTVVGLRKTLELALKRIQAGTCHLCLLGTLL